MNRLIAVLLGALSLCASAEPIDVTIHVDGNYQPYSYRDEDGNAAGVYVEILREAFSRLEDFSVTLKPVPWDRGKLIMEEGKGLGLAPAFFMAMTGPTCIPTPCPSTPRPSAFSAAETY